MRRLRQVLGWIVTIAVAAAFVGGLVAITLGGEIVKSRLAATDAGPTWIGVLMVVILFGGFATFLLYVLFSRKGREARRQARAERAERRRKLENFEL